MRPAHYMPAGRPVGQPALIMHCHTNWLFIYSMDDSPLHIAHLCMTLRTALYMGTSDHPCCHLCTSRPSTLLLYRERALAVDTACPLDGTVLTLGERHTLRSFASRTIQALTWRTQGLAALNLMQHFPPPVCVLKQRPHLQSKVLVRSSYHTYAAY